ncbi:MAG TPA: hypothetical protein VG737_13030 [Cyclobacteriaceae bacterium]|nr:hypothetical protein [Cyclobacteriaceae bacterium]
MKARLGALFVLILIAFSLPAQEIEKCDTNLLLSTSKRVGKLTHKEISDFLMTFGEECRTNVEFSEWSNEVLFSILDQQTDAILRVIDKGEKWLAIEVILESFSAPVNETVRISDLIQKVNATTISSKTKNQVIDRLKMVEGDAN